MLSGKNSFPYSLKTTFVFLHVKKHPFPSSLDLVVVPFSALHAGRAGDDVFFSGVPIWTTEAL